DAPPPCSSTKYTASLIVPSTNCGRAATEQLTCREQRDDLIGLVAHHVLVLARGSRGVRGSERVQQRDQTGAFDRDRVRYDGEEVPGHQRRDGAQHDPNAR